MAVPDQSRSITIVIFFAMLGFLVVIHELGHFVVARLAASASSSSASASRRGPRSSARQGETLYTLNWLPIGGFVRLEGEDGESEDPRSFVRARLPVKLVILLAGVAMNLAARRGDLHGHRAGPPARPWRSGSRRSSRTRRPRPAGLRCRRDAIVSFDSHRRRRPRSTTSTAPSGSSMRSARRPGRRSTLTVAHATGRRRDVDGDAPPPGRDRRRARRARASARGRAIAERALHATRATPLALGSAPGPASFRLILGRSRRDRNPIVDQPTERRRLRPGRHRGRRSATSSGSRAPSRRSTWPASCRPTSRSSTSCRSRRSTAAGCSMLVIKAVAGDARSASGPSG